MFNSRIAKVALTSLLTIMLGGLPAGPAEATSSRSITFSYEYPDYGYNYSMSRIDGFDKARGYLAGYVKMDSYYGGARVRYLTVCDTRTDKRAVTALIYATHGPVIQYRNRCGNAYALGYEIDRIQLSISSGNVSDAIYPPELM